MSDINNSLELKDRAERNKKLKEYLEKESRKGPGLKAFFTKDTLLTILFMSIISAVLIYTYYYVNTATGPLFPGSVKKKTEATKLMERDLELAYPATPAEVLTLYLRITKCLYNDRLSDEELELLLDQGRKLYDQELLGKNPVVLQKTILKEEIKRFRETGKELNTYVVENSREVNYWTEDKVEYASIVASTSFSESKEVTKVFEEFILRKDKDGKWKIIGWHLSDKDSIRA